MKIKIEGRKMAMETSLYTTVAVFVSIFIMMSSMIIIARVSKGKQKTLTEQQNIICPNCDHEIPFDAKVCPYCQYDCK